MMRSRLCLLLVVLGLAAATLACGLWGNRISIDERAEALDDLATFSESLPGLDEDADRQALVDYMRSRPEFESAEVGEDGSVWGEFTDGRLVVFAVPMGAGDESLGGGVSLGAAGLAAHTHSYPFVTNGVLTHRDLGNLIPISSKNHSIDSFVTRTETGELPADASGVIVSALDPQIYSAHEYTIRDLLDQKKYTVSEVNATVDSLKEIDGAAVFFFKTHGSCRKRVGVPDEYKSKIICALMTTTPYSLKNDKTYENDLKNVRLVYMKIWGKWYYGITESFVSEYMHFGKNSFVYIAACFSHNDAMHRGFTAANASVYAGWTGKTNATCDTPASTTLFDLLLGTNQIVKTKPPHRPFEYEAIADYLREKGYDTCGNSKLKFKPLDGEFAILAPSIRNMEVDEQEETLTLHGIFGTYQDQVTINGSSVDIEDWTSEKIVVTLPGAKQSNGYGDVIVTVRDHESNAVPLTRWHGKLPYFIQPIDIWNLTQTVDFDIYFRGDIHPYRDRPGENPIYPTQVPIEVSKASNGTITCSDSEVLDTRLLTDSYMTLTASGTGETIVDYAFEGGFREGSSFNFSGEINAETLTFKWNLHGSVGLNSGCMLTVDGETEPWEVYILDCNTAGSEYSMDLSFNIHGDRVECFSGVLEPAIIEAHTFEADSPPKN